MSQAFGTSFTGWYSNHIIFQWTINSTFAWHNWNLLIGTPSVPKRGPGMLSRNVSGSSASCPPPPCSPSWRPPSRHNRRSWGPRWSPTCTGRTPAGRGRRDTRGYEESCSCLCHWNNRITSLPTVRVDTYVLIPNREKKSFILTWTGNFQPEQKVMHFRVSEYQ